MKAYKFFGAIALIALFASCEKENENLNGNGNGNEPSGPTEVVPQAGEIVCYVPGQMVKTSLGSANDEGQYPVQWVDGDAVKVFSASTPAGATYTTSLESAAASAVFSASGSTVSNSAVRYAVYPASAAGQLADGKVSVDLSGIRTQVYAATLATADVSALPLFAQAATGSDNFSFKNVLGSVCVRINDYAGWNVVIKSVKLTADKYISGTMLVNPDGSVSSLTGTSDEQKTITVESEDGVTINDGEPYLGGDGKAFRFFLPAGEYENLTFEFIDEQGRIFKKETTGNTVVQAGLVQTFQTLQLTLYYGKANCHILKADNTEVTIDATPYYTFNDRLTYDGREVEYAEGFSAPELTASVAWGAGAGTHITRNDKILTCSLTGDDLKVKASSQGNASIVLKNDEEIVWSFHIWITNRNISDFTYVIDSDSFQMMNTNLGAIYTANEEVENTKKAFYKFGMYYQWGRKEPFPVTIDGSEAGKDPVALFGSEKYENAIPTIAYGIQNPLINIRAKDNASFYRQGLSNISLWGATKHKTKTEEIKIKDDNFVKTVYDPCPEGYMVPQAYHFSGLTHKNSLSTRTGGGVQFVYDGTSTDLYALPGEFLTTIDVVAGTTTTTVDLASGRYYTSNAYGGGGGNACYFDITRSSDNYNIWTKWHGGQANCFNIRCLKVSTEEAASTASANDMAVAAW